MVGKFVVWHKKYYFEKLTDSESNGGGGGGDNNENWCLEGHIQIHEKVMNKKISGRHLFKNKISHRSFLPISLIYNAPCLEKRRASVSGRRRTARLTRHSNTYKGPHILPIVNNEVNLSCWVRYKYILTCSRIHERTISLRFLGIILRVLRLEVSVWIS